MRKIPFHLNLILLSKHADLKCPSNQNTIIHCCVSVEQLTPRWYPPREEIATTSKITNYSPNALSNLPLNLSLSTPDLRYNLLVRVTFAKFLWIFDLLPAASVTVIDVYRNWKVQAHLSLRFRLRGNL